METLCCITKICADINDSLSVDKVNEFIQVCREKVPKDKDGKGNFFMEQSRNCVQNFTSVLSSDVDEIDQEQAVEAIKDSTEAPSAKVCSPTKLNRLRNSSISLC